MSVRPLVLILFPILLSGCAAPPRPQGQAIARAQIQPTPPDQKVLIKSEPLKDQYWDSAMSVAQAVKNRHDNEPLKIIFVFCKAEMEAAIFVKGKDDENFTLDCPINIPGPVMDLGPKRELGDHKVPEGLYFITQEVGTFDADEPALELNYPNHADKILAAQYKRGDLGGPVYIRNGVLSNGSIALFSKDLEYFDYYFSYSQRNAYQKTVPVYVFPFAMTDENMAKYCAKFPEYKGFWVNLKTAYDKFNYGEDSLNNSAEHPMLDYTIDSNGNYIVR